MAKTKVELSPAGKPKPRCALVGEDGNAYSIMGRVARALKANGYTKAEVNAFHKAATAGDYNNLLRVAMSYVEDCGTEKCDDCGGDTDDCGGDCDGGDE